jgi:hypothetical protein
MTNIETKIGAIIITQLFLLLILLALLVFLPSRSDEVTARTLYRCQLELEDARRVADIEREKILTAWRADNRRLDLLLAAAKRRIKRTATERAVRLPRARSIPMPSIQNIPMPSCYDYCTALPLEGKND